MVTIRRLDPSLALALLLAGCPPPLPPETTCEDLDDCETSGGSTTGEQVPTTSDGVHTVTSDAVDSSGSTTADTSETTSGTTDEPDAPPAIVDGVVIPDFIEENGLLQVTVTTKHADAVQMLLEGEEPITLKAAGRDTFAGEIAAFTGFDNGSFTAVFTPWRGEIKGAPAEADYVIALPTPGSEVRWDVNASQGNIVAIAVLPDGHPMEFGTLQTMDGPRCYLKQRTPQGAYVDSVLVLAPAYCKAIDMKVDADTGAINLLLARQTDDGDVWWVGDMVGWGAAPQKLGDGVVGDTAFALATRGDVVAVCGQRAVQTPDERDALVVLLRPGKPAEERVFDHEPVMKEPHSFSEAARDCVFADDTLVIVGEAKGWHEGVMPTFRDRIMVIESGLASAKLVWTVAGPDQGVQSRATAITLDDQGQYQLTGTSCLDDCDPVGEVWIYKPGGEFVSHNSLGLLGSAWFGPHDIAWHPAGYAVIAFGELQGKNFMFKVEAIAPDKIAPLWTYVPNDTLGPQFAVAVEVGPQGEVYAAGIADSNHPVFVRIGG